MEKIGWQLPRMKIFLVIYVNLSYVYLKQGMLKAEIYCTIGMKNAIKYDYSEGKKEANMCLVKMLLPISVRFREFIFLL